MINNRSIQGVSFCVFTVVAVSILSFFLTGCEDGKGTHALTVSPAYIDLTATTTNSTQTFTVTEGLRDLSLPLTWSVSDPTLGHIGASGGVSASYIANTKKTGNNTVIVRDQYDAEGIATVRQ